MGTQETKISIIIPVYNTREYLPLCADSLKKQRFQDWEAVLVNDGSTDGSRELCDSLAREDARFRVLHTENGGVSRARNLGLEAARAEYIVFMDSDDQAQETYLERLWQLRQETGAPLAACGYRGGSAEDTTEKKALPDAVPKTERFLRYALSEKFGLKLSVWGVIYPAAWGLRFQEDLAYGEDSLFLCQALKRADRIAYDPSPLYLYNTGREGNTFNTRSLRKYKDSIRVWDSIAELFKEGDMVLQGHLARIRCDVRLQAARQALREKNPEEKKRLRQEARRLLKEVRENPSVREKDKLRLRLLCLSPVWGAAGLELMQRSRHGKNA